jgi:predicted Fe-S protein YdhL (DUF1289 family)
MVAMDSPANAPPMDTPCVKVCTLDHASGLCLGCGRTLAEIARWSAMSASERRRIMDELPARNERRLAAAE